MKLRFKQNEKGLAPSKKDVAAIYRLPVKKHWSKFSLKDGKVKNINLLFMIGGLASKTFRIFKGSLRLTILGVQQTENVKEPLFFERKKKRKKIILKMTANLRACLNILVT
jgi:hypothetical protein